MTGGGRYADFIKQVGRCFVVGFFFPKGCSILFEVQLPVNQCPT